MITCPRCGASNPHDHRFCGKCGQLLQTAPADEQPAASELPAWLSDLGMPDEQPAADTTAAPAWLAQLQQETKPSSTPVDELPAWLRDEIQPQASPSTPTSQGTSDDLPDWLREGQADVAAPPLAPASAPATQELPVWLRDEIQPQPASPTSQSGPDELPPWLRDDETTLPAASAAPGTASGELPDWLREVEAEAVTPSAPTQPLVANRADELPDWLREVEAEVTAPPSAPASAPGAAAGELPDWLREVEAEAAIPSPSSPTSASGPDELPPWLRDDETTLPAASSTPGAAAGELPDWLREVEAETVQPLPAPASAPGAAAGELPDWLREVEVETVQPLPAPASAPGAAAGELPDWLREVDTETVTPSAATQPLAPPSADELPAWLREDPPVEVNSAPAASRQDPSDSTAPLWLVADPSTAPEASLGTSPSDAAAQPLDLPLPDWSSEFGAPPVQETSPPEADELPAWLREPGPSASAAEPAAPSWLGEDAPAASYAPRVDHGVGSADELPAWLVSETAEPAPTTGADRGAPTQELPAWLLDQPEVPAESASPITSSAAPDDLPPWLSADEPAAEASVTKRYDAPADDGLPAWLAADAPAAEASVTKRYDAPEAIAPVSPAADTVELPAWLSQDDQPSGQASSSSTTDGDLPPWLSGITAEEPAPSASSGGPALPSWLEEPDQPAPQPAAAPAAQSEFLGGLDLPAWLRAEQEAEAAKQPVAEPAPSWLQRVAPESDEPVAAVAAAPEAGAAPRIVRSPERVAAMQLLEQLVAAPAPEPLPQPVKRRRSLLVPVLFGLAVLLIVGGILFVLFNPRLGLNFGAAPLPAPAISAVSQSIAALPANKPVVLAYDWDAQRFAEMGALEDAVIGQLVQRRNVPLAVVSTDPQGALLADARADQLRALGDDFYSRYGLGLVNLGFKAGGPIALHRFADNAAFGDLFAQDAFGYDLRSEPVTMQSFCGADAVAGCAWDDVGMLVLMADELADVRGWFEQVRSAHPTLPVVLLTPAEIGPQVQPYAATANTSVLSGLQAAEAYNRSLGIEDERLGRQVDATALGGSAFALLVLIGAVPAYITGRRERQADEEQRWMR